jgi:hypothetical protein
MMACSKQETESCVPLIPVSCDEFEAQPIKVRFLTRAVNGHNHEELKLTLIIEKPTSQEFNFVVLPTMQRCPKRLLKRDKFLYSVKNVQLQYH